MQRAKGMSSKAVVGTNVQIVWAQQGIKRKTVELRVCKWSAKMFIFGCECWTLFSAIWKPNHSIFLSILSAMITFGRQRDQLKHRAIGQLPSRSPSHGTNRDDYDSDQVILVGVGEGGGL